MIFAVLPYVVITLVVVFGWPAVKVLLQLAAAGLAYFFVMASLAAVAFWCIFGEYILWFCDLFS